MRSEAKSVSHMNLPLARSGWSEQNLCAVAGRAVQAGDLIILAVSCLAVVVLPYLHNRQLHFSEFLELRVSLRNVLVAVMLLSTWRLVLSIMGIYSPNRSHSFLEYFARCWVALSGCMGVLAALEMLLKPILPIPDMMSVFWILSALLMTASRLMLYNFNRFVRPLLRPKRNLLIIGTGPRARKAYEDLKAHTELNYTILGFIDSEYQPGNVPSELYLCDSGELEQYLMREIVDEVVIALPIKSQYENIGRAVALCQQLGIQSQYFTDQFSTAVTNRQMNAGAQSGRVVLNVVQDDYRRYFKRSIDVIGALLGLLLLSPLLLATALAVYFTSEGPVIFKQERFGRNKRLFFMFKFRSMVVDAEARQSALEHLNEVSGPAFKIKSDPRVTPIGALLRKLSIDELPQLVNVLRGDMSLVGPRPLPIRDVNRFSEAWLMRRFSVKPGCTCLWQVMGRSNTNFARWIELDLQYIDNWSLTLDMLILFKTVPAVLRGRGAS